MYFVLLNRVAVLRTVVAHATAATQAKTQGFQAVISTRVTLESYPFTAPFCRGLGNPEYRKVTQLVTNPGRIARQKHN